MAGLPGIEAAEIDKHRTAPARCAEAVHSGWLPAQGAETGRTPQVRSLSAAGAVYFDVAMVEGIGGVAKLAAEVSPARVLFGSHSPFFYFESAELKVKEAGLPDIEARAIGDENARRLLKGQNK